MRPYEGIQPSPVTVLNVLSGVSESGHNDVLHACVVKRGNLAEVLNLFSRMRLNKLEPDQQTFGSLVSAVARQGSIEVGRVAHAQIITSGFELDKHVGTSLVSLLSQRLNIIACRNNGHEELGRAIAEEISDFEPADAGRYVQLAQSFASMARWDGVGEAWARMKAPGWSIVQMHSIITPFFTQQRSHSEYETIVCMLRNLTDDMKKLALASKYEDFSSYIDIL
ncbi:hypothetical protein C2S52_002127 [Perilla frutescens var. hirtella]|uniref:Pentatricopeptide repeat-containing protein n=1 Tax=Perilla frutescens var. hirtella TaxID=608512 RepID=A0AAD4JI80_PERFH|nr:hypothetical protein C2S52_002127 [Perilla frutescens var. hirtella]KAH6834271.1 hypothetical protein C2S53_004634 [Perilla frutescens var. hirtella]